jgi:hypothetical protein
MLDLMHWNIVAPTAAELAAHLAPRAAKRRKGAAGAVAALPQSSPLPYQLQMHFIQIKVGKLIHDVPAAKLSLSFNFASPGSALFAAFEQRVLAMQNIAVDAVYQAAAAAAGIAGVPAAVQKEYKIQATFELVTSRRLSAQVKSDLRDHRISVTSATDSTFWGPRVRAYCASSNFALFQ